jgi:molybdenum cofactor guanylyltransferase
MDKKNITGIVLAGGKSSRFGSDKALAPWKGKTLLENAIQILSPLCQKVVISSNNPEYDFTGCEVWPDEFSIQAPMIGIYSCLKRSQTELNLILSCDMPLMVTELFFHLINHSNNFDATVPSHHEKQTEPLCGIYKHRLIPVFEKFIKKENYSLQRLLKDSHHNTIVIYPELSFYHESLFSNINTLSDFNNISI